MKKKLSIFGMPVEVRDYVPESTITIVEKLGKRLTVFNETTGSEAIYENPPKLHVIKNVRTDSKEGEA